MPEEDPIVIIQGSKWKTGLAVAGFAIVLLGMAAGGYFLKRMYDENQRLMGEVVQFKTLTETLVRSSTQWATKKDLEAALAGMLSKDDLKAVRDDLDKLGASLTAVGRTVGAVRRKVSALEKSDHEGPPNDPVATCPGDGRPIDIHGYTRAPQIKELKDANEAPIAKAEFNAAEKKPWKYEIYKRKYSLATAVGRKDSGQMTFHHALEYEVPGRSNKKFPVELESSKYLQVPRTRRMFWWTPALDMGAFAGGRVHSITGDPGGVFSFGADIGFSFSSYGRTKADSLLRLFRMGAGYDAQRTTAHFSFAPIQANLGDPLPLLTNLWFWPYIGADTGGGIGIGLGMGLRL